MWWDSFWKTASGCIMKLSDDTHSVWPQTFTISFNDGFLYLVVLHLGHPWSSILGLYTTENPRKCPKLSTFLLLAGSRLQRHTESRPTRNGTNEKRFLYNDCLPQCRVTQGSTWTLRRFEFNNNNQKKGWVVCFHSSTQMICWTRMWRTLVLILGFTISVVQYIAM